MATPTTGTIPALPQYQPGALSISGQEIAEIASTSSATTAASYQINIAQFVGKVPSVLSATNPGQADLIMFFQKSSGLPFSATIANLGIPSGNIPTGGGSSFFLVKNSSTNFDANWTSLATYANASTGLFITGSTTITYGIATGGVGAAQIATNSVGNAQIRQGAGLSIVGVSGNALANVADITASGANQILSVNAAGTVIGWQANTTVMPGPFQTGTLTIAGVLYGLGTSVVGITAAGGTALPLVANGGTTAPTFTLLTVPGGGTGTSTLTAHGLLLGAGTSTVKVSAVGTAGQLYVGQNATTDAAWSNIAGDLTLSSAGTGTISSNVVSFGKFQQIGPGELLGNFAAATGNITGTTVVTLGATSFTSILNLAGQTSGVVSIIPQQTAGTYNFNLATTAGVAGQVLLSGGGTTSPMTWTSSVSGVGFGLTGATATSFAASISTTNPPYGFDMPINMGFTASVLTGVLTVSFLAANGANATAGNPILVPFRNTNVTSGLPGWATITSSLSISTLVGASFGAASSSSPFRLWSVLFYQNATSVIPALINCSNTAQVFPLQEHTLATTIAMTATATLAGTFYSPSGTTALNAPFRIVGFVEYANGLATAGTFSTAPTSLQSFGPGIRKPGDIVQTIAPQFGTLTVASFTATLTTTNVSATISPTSSINLVRYFTSVSLSDNGAAFANHTAQLFRLGSAIGAVARAGAGISIGAQIALIGYDAPATTAPIYYVLKAASATSVSTTTVPGVNTDSATEVLEEIMG